MNLNEWFSHTIQKIGFEDIKKGIHHRNTILINTLSSNEQQCLIQNTLDIRSEESTINDLLDNYKMKQIHIIVYGKNNTDDTVEKKYRQLRGLGFSHVYIYYGGMFEWLLLQDIYGTQEFPTTTKILDILKYGPPLLADF